MTTPERFSCPICEAETAEAEDCSACGFPCDAAQMIRELRAELERKDAALSAMAKQREWISVKERMPADDSYVLIHGAEGAEHHVAWFDLRDGTWADRHGVLVGNITHWMPLLAPPHDPTESP